MSTKTETTEASETVRLADGTLVTKRFADDLGNDSRLYYSAEGLVGQSVFVRTVTMYFVGEAVGYNPNTREMILRKCTWIASTGKWTDFIAKGAISEAEVYKFEQVNIVRMDTVVDYCRWDHPLPNTCKSNS